MHRKRSQRKKIIIGLICVLTLMSVGYAAFQGNLKIKGTTKITSLWDVRITNVTSGTPTGSAVNKIAPTWDGLTANMEADLYEKGDAMDYDVTITNNGTVDAVLSDIIGTPSNNEAVIITFSGYAKGEKLYKKGHEGNTKVVHVKIAYNPNYDGGETSGEASVEFNFTQAEGSGIDISDNKKLLTYDYSYNGGTSSQTHNEYVDPGTTVTLNKTASKSGWTFVGWNTNREAVTGMSSVKVDNDTTVYALFSKTITVNYTKGENVQSISKESDTCTLYNKQTSCSTTLPTITPNEGYTCKWYTEATGGEEIGEGGATWTPSIGSAAYTRCGDSKEPSVGDIEGGEEAKGESQNLLLKATDESGIAAYYFGTTEPTSADVITTNAQSDLTAIQGSGLTKNITEEGTYWFAVKDEAGNFSKKSITIRKYQVQTVLEKIAGTTGTYNSTNYETAGEPKTYYVKDGTTLSLQDIYTVPLGGTADTFKGSNTSAPSTASSSLSNESKKITNDTSIYYMWFNRATYKVTVTKPTNGTVKAETVTKTGNSVTASTTEKELTVKYGDTVKATATPNTNCSFEGWSGGYVTGTTIPITGIAVTENKTITATFKALPIIKSWSYSASTDFHNSTYRTNITSVIFEDSINIPEGATSWDVSAVSNSGAVMAWVTADPEDSTKYVLHIGGNGGVIANQNSSYIFYNFTNVKSINFNNNFDTSNATNMHAMFQKCSNLTSLDLGDKFDTSNVTNMSSMFSSCSALTSLDLGNKFDTSSVMNMQQMFYNCSSLTSLDLDDKFDTSSVTNMLRMFESCNNLTNLDLGDKFDTSSVTTMGYMFNSCSSLTNLDLGDKFDTSSATTMRYMFGSCSSLTNLDLGDKFDTSSVTDMRYMFGSCSSLTNLDLGDKFDTSNVTIMSSMFSNCSVLTSLDLGDKFDTSSVTTMGYMFNSCLNIETIFAPESFVTTNVTDSTQMFMSDTKLVGGNGTAYNSGYVDKTYAKIDKPGQEGYFTRSFAAPKFTEAEGANNSVDVTITFPAACSTDLTCKYKKDDGSYVTVTSTSATVNFTGAGILVATVTDGTNTKSGSYTVLGKTSMDIVSNAGESCDGELVEDTYEPGRYIYRGHNPCNYINIKENGTNVKYRIYSIEADGTMKVIRDEAVIKMNFDADDATRRKGGYCTSNYCNAWAAMDNFVNGSYSGAVAGLNGNSGDSSIKEYIDNTYKNTLDDYSKIVSKTWNISGTEYNRDTLENAIADEKKSTWNGKIALLTASEYVRANTNTSSCGTLSNLKSNYSTCKSTNYLVKSSTWWLLSPSSSNRFRVLYAFSDSNVAGGSAADSRGVRPSFYLCSGLVYSGDGSENNPYEIAGGSCPKTTYTGPIYRWSTASALNGSTIKEKTIYNITSDGQYGHGPAGDYETLEACESDRNSKYGGSMECKQFDLAALEYTTNPATLGKNHYLKHDVVDDIITASYVCFVYNNAEHCMKGADNGDSFAANTQMIQDYKTFYNLGDYNYNNGNATGCDFASSSSTCYGGGMGQVSAGSGGFVIVYGSSSERCVVDYGGISHCLE